MKRFKRVSALTLFLLLIVYLCLRFGNRRIDKVSPRNPGTDTQSPTVEIAFFNSHLLPPIAKSIVGKRSSADYRCTQIADQLSQFDLLGLSEVFDEKLAAKMIDKMNADPKRVFSFSRSPSPTGVFQFASGGLILFSRFPILEKNSLVFSDGSRFLTSGFRAADGLAAKGALHAAIKLNATQELDCFLVHLESFSASIRNKQVDELVAFINSHHRVGVPYLLMGDFNIKGPQDSDSPEHKEYIDLVTRSSMSGFKMVDLAMETLDGNLAKGTSDALSENGGDRIDYLLLAVPTSDSIEWSATSKTIRFLDDVVKEGSLSDHAAVWARIRLN